MAPSETVALKAALDMAARKQGVTAAQLGRRLRVDHKEARRLLDPTHPSKLPRLAEALRSLGLGVALSVFDAARRTARPRTPAARRRAAGS
ncbi:MAG: hypothetical protein ACT4P2_14525 [Pseudomonadota bacterium]